VERQARRKEMALMELVSHQTQQLSQLSRRKDGSLSKMFRISSITLLEKN
jgi:hypothetical protein